MQRFFHAFRPAPEGFLLSQDEHTALIRIENLTHTYRPAGAAPLTALRSVSLHIRAGEYVALIGANGSGKTTLARHLNALLLPDEGDVWVDGLNTRDRANHRAIRATVGMVFQSPADQIVATVVQEDVAFGPENLGVPQPELQARVREALTRVSMWECRERPPHLLSPGQQQRVAIAATLAMRPRCLVLDEATAMLDPAGRRDLWQIVDDLHAGGMTIVAITHDMDEAARAARVIVLAAGRVALDGPPGDVLADGDRLAALGVALPTVPELAHQIRRRCPHHPLPANIITAPQLARALLGWHR